MSETLSDWLRLSHPVALILVALGVGLIVFLGFRKIGKSGGCCGPKSNSNESKVSKGSCCQ